MALIKAVLSLFTALPGFMTLVTKLVDGLTGWIQEMELKRKLAELDKAAEKAKKEKNTCELEKMLDPNKKCDPPSPPSGGV